MYKISSWIVDVILRFWQSIPILVIHNLDKARTLKKVFWHLNVDGMEGDYIEFGVAHGHSMRAAQYAVQQSSSKSLGIKHIPRDLYGFDTFDKFIGGEFDSHPTWEGNAFNASYSKVSKRFASVTNVHLHQIDVNLLDVQNSSHSYSSFGINRKAAVILFDMDLYTPTRSALFWMKGLIQQGTFLIFDELHAFAGDSNKGEARALNEFIEMNPLLSLREFCNYGAGGKVFIVDLSNKNTV